MRLFFAALLAASGPLAACESDDGIDLIVDATDTTPGADVIDGDADALDDALADTGEDAADADDDLVDADVDVADTDDDATDADDVDDDATARPVQASWSFTEGRQGWLVGVSDYSPGQESSIDFTARLRDLPRELDAVGTGLYLEGTNVSDDLFMFLERELGRADGLVPGQAYTVTFRLRFASNAPSGCIGIGGAPGESVYLKAGASPADPQVVFDPVQDLFVMNVDKGNQSQGGPAASVVGDIANGVPCDEALPDPEYVTLTRVHTHERPVTADAEGRLWLLVGTDSGFEGPTGLYYQAISVTLEPVR